MEVALIASTAIASVAYVFGKLVDASIAAMEKTGGRRG